MLPAELDAWHMRRALDLAACGEGRVEPNPMVGCVIARGAEIIGEGWHRRFGGPHAEVEALAIAGPRAAGATVYVTLEPCCHHGKTPPCTKALLTAGVARVVVAQLDPFPRVAGGGLEELRRAGVEVQVGLLEPDARGLNAPYLKLLHQGRPWVMAKWAMTLDGKIATRTGASRWISGEGSRAIVHALRGRVDAVVVGRGTAQADDPLLSARPPGPRTAARIVLDSRASLASESQLVRSAGQSPVIVVAGGESTVADRRRLEAAGCELLLVEGATRRDRLGRFLDLLGARRMTNILVEGGAELLGELHDADAIDELHVFVAPRLVGGKQALGPIAGLGVAEMARASALEAPEWREVDGDLYLCGRVQRSTPAADAMPPG